MSQEVQHSILEYARLHKIARDHLESDPLANLGHIDDNCTGPFEDLANCISITEFDGSLAEKFSFSKDAIYLLSSVTKIAQGKDILDRPEYVVDAEFDPHRVRHMKQELPVIRTDHELDMTEFASQIVPDLEYHFIPLVLVDEEADGGLTWPSKYNTLPVEYTQKSESENLAVSSEALVCLQETLRLAREKIEFPDDQVLSYEKVCEPYSFLDFS